MKTANPDLVALINSGQFTYFDVYTVVTTGNGTLYFTAADFDIAYGGVKWSADGVRLGSGSLAHWKIGLEVDQWQMTLYPRRRDEVTGASFPDVIGTIPFLQAAASGVFDGALVTIQRAFFATMPVWPISSDGAVPVGLLTIFKGNVAECDVTTTSCILTVNDARYILNTQMPRNLYQPSCRHRLFDVNCKLVASAYEKTAVVGSGTTRNTVMANVPAPGGSNTYQLGSMSVKSGKNKGFRRTISGWDGGQTFTAISPFPFDFALGDSIYFYPGCGKTMGDCNAFGNLPNYGGNPFVPPPETTA